MMGPVYQPKDNELLHEWLRDGRSYSKGQRIEASNFEMNDGNRQLEISLEACFILRHIMFSFNLPIEVVIALWACYYVLIMRRPLPKEYFRSQSAVWVNIFRASLISDKLATIRFQEFVSKKSKYGFTRRFYVSTDDSDHFGCNRHVLLASDNAGGDEVDPSYRHLTSSVSITKDSEGNSNKNVDSLIDTYGLKCAAHLGGGTTDNASDARKETADTFTKVMAKLSANGELQDLTIVNGVERRPITFGDLFHVDNLVVTHASIAAWGDVTKEDHQQVHHRQVLQSIHSLHTADRGFSQEIMDEVMEGADESVSLKTSRERPQRWLVNQRNAKRVLSYLEMKTRFTLLPSLVAWGIAFHNWSRSEWKRRVGGEVATWLSMPEVILGLHYEAELGEYFEETYYWHNRTGPFNSRPGFRMMEVHDLYFHYMLPWWNDAIENPAAKMPKTFAYLDANFEGDEKEKRRAQIVRGIKAGRTELIKMTQKAGLLDGPVAFLIMCDKEHGPAFLRALLAVVDEGKQAGEPAISFLPDDCSELWGKFRYDDRSERPEDEQRWYDQLKKDPEDVVHWWRQLCLDWPILTDDLQRLSREQGPRACKGGPPLVAFRNTYPILYDCMHATFGLMMSNSRLCEQVHGMMRHGLRAGTGMDEADNHRSYAVGTDHDMKEERRKMVEPADTSTSTNRDSPPTKKKKKTERHCHTKEQQHELSRQLVERAPLFAKAAKAVIDLVPKVGTIVNRRRTQDEAHLAKKMEAERARRANMTREMLQPDQLVEMARATTLSNDPTMTHSDGVVDRRKKLKEMTTLAFWNKLKPNAEYKLMFRAAVSSFPHLDALIGRPSLKNERIDKPARPALTSKTAVMEVVVKPYLTNALKISRGMYEIMYGVKDSKNEVDKRERTLALMDIVNLFVVLTPSAWGDEVTPTVTLDLVGSFMTMDPHYSHFPAHTIEDTESQDDQNDNYGQVVEELAEVGGGM
mmetsp:Transcript_5656/g.15886  ORF Transcript_5656/g.15886 Transcript_5656/m.15886 type:complete len:972 (+) Transcript_5656:584-3499(+)